jgi:tRNA-dihydrouridine synthase C
MPVVANGDIACAESLAACQRQSGASAFMIGRGALARPYLFRTLRGEPTAQLGSLDSYCRVLLRYEALMQEGGFEPLSRLARLKQWLSLARTFEATLGPLFDRFKRSHALDDALLLLRAESALRDSA